MPTLTIYVTDEMYDKVRASPSRIIRAALETYFKNESRESHPSEKGTGE